MRQLVTDGVVRDLAYSQSNNQPMEFVLSIDDRGAAEMFAGLADGDRGVFQLGKIAKRALHHVQGATRDALLHLRRQSERH